MEKARPLPDSLVETHPKTLGSGGGRRKPTERSRELGERPVEQQQPVHLFDIEDNASGSPDFAVQSDPKTGLIVFVDGRGAPEGAASHVADDIAKAGQNLPSLLMDEAIVTGNLGRAVFRPRRTNGEEMLAAAVEGSRSDVDLFRDHAGRTARGDRETALEIPASAAMAIVPERIIEDEIIGADRDKVNSLIGKMALTADDATWKTEMKKYADDELTSRKTYEASKARLAPLLNRASRYLKSGKTAKLLEGGEHDILAALKRGAADFLARFDKEPYVDPRIEMRRQKKKDYQEGKEGSGGIYERIAALPIFSAAEKAAFKKLTSSLHGWYKTRVMLEELVEEREELAVVRGLVAELLKHPQDAESGIKHILQTDNPHLDAIERMLIAEMLVKHRLIHDPRLLVRLREPNLTPEERATVDVLEDVLRVRQEPVTDVMATDAFRELSRSGRYALAARLYGKIANLERLRLLETRAVVISGRLGNDILVYRLRNGKLEPLHDAMMRRGQETFKLRGMDRPIRANQTARESFSAEFSDQFVILPAEHAQLRADVTLAAAKDPEDMLRRMVSQEHYPMVKITVRPPKSAAASPAIDTEAKAS